MSTPAASADHRPAQPQVVMRLPFTSAAHEHTEPAFTRTVTPGTAEQVLDPIDIPATGYLRSVLLEVSGAGGVAGTAQADAPWNLFTSIGLQDVNGANLIGPIDGYALYAVNIITARGIRQDPANTGANLTAPNFSFMLRVPVEINASDGLGSLANQNAAAQLKLNLAINTLAKMFTSGGQPTTAPTFTIKGWVEAWTVPAGADSQQRPQEQTPPLLGTSMYVSQRRQSVLAGDNTVQLTRLGQLIRNVLFIGRGSSGSRDDSVFPDPFRFEWDGMTLRDQSLASLNHDFIERVGGSFSRPTGVVVLPFGHGGTIGRLGNEAPNLWLPTQQSSRLEVKGTSGNDGSIQVVTIEVAPVEVNQAERYQFPNDSAFVPRS